MPITPDECPRYTDTSLQNHQEIRVEKFCEKLDEELKENYIGGVYHPDCTKEFLSFDKKDRLKITRLYADAGWTISLLDYYYTDYRITIEAS